MFLKRRLASSGIAEVVIALAVISMCFTIGSLVFIRANSSPMRYVDVKKQTEIQSALLNQMFLLNADSVELFDPEIEEEVEDPELKVLVFRGSDNRKLWIQQVFQITNGEQ